MLCIVGGTLSAKPSCVFVPADGRAGGRAGGQRRGLGPPDTGLGRAGLAPDAVFEALRDLSRRRSPPLSAGAPSLAHARVLARCDFAHARPMASPLPLCCGCDSQQ
jgi:hypothetical protein